MIKKFKIELFVFCVLTINIFVSSNFDEVVNRFLYNFIKHFDSFYLKDFFVQITTLGDSKWYFGICFVVLISLYLIQKIFPNGFFLNNIAIFKNLNIFILVSLFFTGIITQIIKHLIGRPRPNHSDGESSINFLSFNSEFHSFPSGHASTIFLIILAVVVFFPKLKYFLFPFAAIIAFSRVVVGAHFVTDVIGGVVIAFVGLKLTTMFFNKYFQNILSLKKPDFFSNNFFIFLIILFLLSLVFAVGSSIDIYLSNVFYYGDNQFALQSYYNVTIFFRKIVLPLVILYIFVLPIFSKFLSIHKIYFNYKFNFGEILFLWISAIFNLIIIINLVLKNNWGRARPGDVRQLGGEEDFTPWHIITNHCSENCSFVSGDAAVGFSLLVFYFLTKKNIYLALSLFFGFCLGIIRIMEGGHFASDVILSAFVVWVLCFVETKYYKKYV